MRIKYIVPFPLGADAVARRAVQIPPELAGPGVEVDFVTVRDSARLADSQAETLALEMYVYEAGMRAEEEGYDAVCIDTASDSGLAALRSRLRIPVVGPGLAAVHVAAMLGHRFGVISLFSRWADNLRRNMISYQMDHMAASFRSLSDVSPDVSRLLEDKEEHVFPQLLTLAEQAVETDGADVIILASTTMHAAAEYLADRLPVPVINPGPCAVRLATDLVVLGLTHSRYAYPGPATPPDALFAALPSAEAYEPIVSTVRGRSASLPGMHVPTPSASNGHPAAVASPAGQGTVAQASLQWTTNPSRGEGRGSEASRRAFPGGVTEYHRRLPGYQMTPLVALPGLAAALGIGSILVKDESRRFGLPAFKVLGGSYAAHRVVERRLAAGARSPENITLATATDGNHGQGLAWAASQLGCASVVYVHKGTSTARISAIESHGARVHVVDGNYDDAVARLAIDAEEYGWDVVADTSWEDYREVPLWIMQGYQTMFSEVDRQLLQFGDRRPTHVMLQGGVGAFAAAGAGYYHAHHDAPPPHIAVVEPDAAACLLASAQAGDGLPHRVHGPLDTIMAGLACGAPSPLAWEILRDCVDTFIACPDYVAAAGVRLYANPLPGDPVLHAGESGAVTLGALTLATLHDHATRSADSGTLRAQLGLGPDSTVLLINTEGYTDPGACARLLWDGDMPVPVPYKIADRLFAR